MKLTSKKGETRLLEMEARSSKLLGKNFIITLVQLPFQSAARGNVQRIFSCSGFTRLGWISF